jgi:hypothetical protein
MFDLLANGTTSDDLSNVSSHPRPKGSGSDLPISSLEPGMRGAGSGPMYLSHNFGSYGRCNA